MVYQCFKCNRLVSLNSKRELETMYKFVLFSVLLAVAAARPGFLHGEHAALVAAPIAIPSAVSHSSRVDFHTHPVAVVKTAPVLVKAVHAPIIAAPVAHVALPSAVSHSSRYDVHHSVPVVASYGVALGHGGLYGHGLGHGYGLGHGLHGW